MTFWKRQNYVDRVKVGGFGERRTVGAQMIFKAVKLLCMKL